MPLSEARIEANRRNAARSTGPRSPEGKDRSRANALKHGFCSEVVGIEDPRAVLDRAGAIDPTTTPVTGFDGWAAGQVAVLSLRIERCQDSERAIRDRIVARAEVTWDEDRRLEATLLGANLGKRPEEVSARLRETYHGCEWLLARWAMLAHSARTPGGWTAEHQERAFDLLGTPLEFRDGCSPGTAIDPHGEVIGPTVDELAVALREIAELHDRRESLRPLDDAARERAEADLAADADPELKRLRRYEASLQRRLEWSLGLLQALSTRPPSAPEPEPESKPGPDAKPTASPVAIRATPMVATAGVPGVPSPVGPPSRAEIKLKKAESRREARLRKLDSRRN